MTNRISKVIQNGTEYIVGWVDSVNWTTWAVTLKTVNNNALDGTGNISIEPWITKIFNLSSTSDLTTAQQAYDWYANGGNPIITVGTSVSYYHLRYYDANTNVLEFVMPSPNWDQNPTNVLFGIYKYQFTISSWEVTAVSQIYNTVYISNGAPASWVTNNRITLVI